MLLKKKGSVRGPARRNMILGPAKSLRGERSKAVRCLRFMCVRRPCSARKEKKHPTASFYVLSAPLFVARLITGLIRVGHLSSLPLFCKHVGSEVKGDVGHFQATAAAQVSHHLRFGVRSKKLVRDWQSLVYTTRSARCRRLLACPSRRSLQSALGDCQGSSRVPWCR